MTDEELNAAFSAWLRAKAGERGLNYGQLADEVGAARSNARNWWFGANLPDWHNCREIGRVLQVAKEEVRRRAGFVDPDDDSPIDEELAELSALWGEADPDDRSMLLRLARLQRGSPANRGRRG